MGALIEGCKAHKAERSYFTRFLVNFSGGGNLLDERVRTKILTPSCVIRLSRCSFLFVRSRGICWRVVKLPRVGDRRVGLREKVRPYRPDGVTLKPDGLTSV